MSHRHHSLFAEPETLSHCQNRFPDPICLRRVAERSVWPNVQTVLRYRSELVAAVRHRCPDVNAGCRDAELTAAAKDVYNVTWDGKTLLPATGPNRPRLASFAVLRPRNRTEQQPVFLVFYIILLTEIDLHTVWNCIWINVTLMFNQLLLDELLKIKLQFNYAKNNIE